MQAVPDGYDVEAAEVLDALETLAARDLIPSDAGDGAAVSGDGQVLVCWVDLGETDAPGGEYLLRFEAYVHLTGTATDAERSVDPVFFLPGWGQRPDGSRLTRLPAAVDTATRSRVAGALANRLARHLDTPGAWHHLLNQARTADRTWS